MNLKSRIDRIRENIIEQDIDAALISSPHNKYYLGELYSGSGYIFISRNSQYIIVDFRYYEEFSRKNSIFNAIMLSKDNTLDKIINDIISIEKIKNIGFEGQEVSYNFYNYLKNSLNCSLVSFDLSKTRMIKDDEEISNIKRACQIADNAFNHIISYIKDGMTERQVENELVSFIKDNGGQKESFDIIVASGARGALPHGKASDKIIRTKELITMDFGVRYKYYCSDITRTIALGSCPIELKKVYGIVKAAGEEAMKNAKPGITIGELDYTARSYIEEAGFGKYFGHNLGHGLGILVHEYPDVASESTEILKTGMVITIEPGIYLPEVGGVRIEEDILITEGGCERLTNSTRDLIII